MKFKDLERMITRMIQPLINRVMMMIGRAVLSSDPNDTTKIQTVQIDLLSEETLDELERFQQYGFTAVPKNGAEAIVIFPTGNRDHGVVINVDDRNFRLTGLENGEVAMYSDEGDKIHIKRGGELDIIQATKVNIVAPDCQLTCSGSVHLDSPDVQLGETAAEAIVKGDAFKTYFDSHTHICGAAGYPSQAPVVPMPASTLSTVSTTE